MLVPVNIHTANIFGLSKLIKVSDWENQNLGNSASGPFAHIVCHVCLHPSWQNSGRWDSWSASIWVIHKSRHLESEFIPFCLNIHEPDLDNRGRWPYAVLSLCVCLSARSRLNCWTFGPNIWCTSVPWLYLGWVWWRVLKNMIFEPTCALCTVGSYASLSVCLSVWTWPKITRL